LPTKARPSSHRLLALAAALLAGAAVAAPVAEQRTALKEQQGDLRSRIEALRHDLAGSEETRASAADQLRETESAISDSNRKLQRLTEQRQAVQQEVQELEAQAQRLQHQTAGQQSRLSRLLHRRYTRGGTDTLQLVLAGQDPNQAAVDHHLLTVLARATADLIADLRLKAREKLRLTESARQKSAELATIEERQQQARQALLDQQRQRQVLLAQLADKIRGQRRELGSLQKDEKRLGRLIEGLARIVRKSARPRLPTTEPATKTHEVVRSERLPDPAQAGGAFAALKGQLRLPVRGEITNRFGKPRPEGGTTWKGLYIRATEGTQVRAVAAGQVVYADWLRGFGNLLVVDHGDEFLSVYGYNQSLLRETGDQIKAGEAIATVGNSGGNAESGLYFELRHQGQAFDPLRWVSLR
jgi:septal ring factor EnvC (AmiA/AmiB activator)